SAAQQVAEAETGIGVSAAPPPEPEPDIDPMDAALARMARSREALRHTLMPPRRARVSVDDAGVPRSGLAGLPRQARRWWAFARRRMGDSPFAIVAFDTVQTWWQRHPWRAAGEALVTELDASLRPAARRHPGLTLALAAGAGAALVATRPWQWRWLGAQVRALPPRALRWTMLQLSQAPVQALLAGWVLARGGQAVAASASPPPSADDGLPVSPAGHSAPR
ncbi:MAG: hypothetical protein ABI696_17940, partial [Rubrivivax sp.]